MSAAATDIADTEPKRRLLRSRVGMRLALAIFVSIAVIEASILVPSYRNYESDLIGRLEHAGRAAALATFGARGHFSDRDLLINARIMGAGSAEFAGGAIYHIDGTFIGDFGEPPDLTLDKALTERPPLLRSADGRYLEVAWIGTEVGLPVTLIGRLDAEWIGEELSVFVKRVLVIVLVLSAVVCGTAMLIFNRMVLASVLRVRDRMIAAPKDPTNTDALLLPGRRTDEIGELQNAFNVMVLGMADNIRRLEGAHKALHEAKDGLDKTVLERTSELRESEARFKDFAEIASDWYWESDAEHRFTDFSVNTFESATFDWSHPLGKTRLELRLPEDTEDERWGRHLSDLEAQRPFRNFVYKVKDAKGEYRHVKASGKPIYDAEGNFVGYRGTGSDITELRRRDQVLRQSEQRYRNLVEGSIQGLLVHAGNKPVFANQAFANILGYDSVDEILRVESVDEFLHPDEVEQNRKIREARLRGEAVPEIVEVHAVRGDGSTAWLEARPTVIEWDGMRAIQMTCVDITERKRAEDTMRAAEERNRLILESAGEGLYGLDLQGRTTFVNGAATRMIGWSPDELIGKPQHDILHHTKPDGTPYPREECPIYAVLEDGTVHHVTDEVFWRKDGSSFPVEYTSTPMRRGKEVTGAVVVFRDISDRKRADAALRDSEQRFRDIAEAAADWIWETDAEHRFTFLTDRYFELTGIEPKTVIGKTRWEALPLRHQPKALRRLRAILDEHRSYRDLSLQTKLPDGRIMYTISSGKPVFDEDGAFRGYRGTGTDHTAHKQAEDALSRAYDELESKVEERTQELREEVVDRQLAQEEATRANQAKSEFLSSMSHELRTPLNAILGFAQLMRDYSDQPLTEEQSANVEQILDGGKHLLGLINEVLDLSKIESGRLSLLLEPVDPVRFIQDNLMLVQPLADEREITIIDGTDIASGVRMTADPARLKQVFLNVLSNAVKYNCDKGTVTVDAATTDSEMLRINVTDTGPGILAERHDEVFHPFSRLGAEASNIEGTGIGLTISRQLIESMGGSLDFDSTVGEGCTFWFEVPIAQPQSSSDRDA